MKGKIRDALARGTLESSAMWHCFSESDGHCPFATSLVHSSQHVLMLFQLGLLCSCVLRKFLKQPVEEGRMPERNGAELTMFGAAGFAVVDDRRNAAGSGEAIFKLLDLLDWHKVIVLARQNEHIARYALRHILKRISAKDFGGSSKPLVPITPPLF